MVACTFLSGPLMFISAKMIAASAMNPDETEKVLSAFQLDISVLSLIGGVSLFSYYLILLLFCFHHNRRSNGSQN